MRFAATILLAGLMVAPAGAHGGTLERVRDAKILSCGAVARAGFASARPEGGGAGLGVDLCRALTLAVLGPEASTAFRLYGGGQEARAIADGRDDVAFFTVPELVEHGLSAATVPGPPVFVAGLTALARPGTRSIDGKIVCFFTGSPAHQAIEAFAARAGVSFVRSGFQEDGELADAFDAHRCDAVTGEAASLAALRDEAPGRADARLLHNFAVMPVLTITRADDAAWAGLVFWAISAIVQSDAAKSPWRGTPPGTSLHGLRPGWLDDVQAALGDFATMRRRAFPPLAPEDSAGHEGALWPEGMLLPDGPR